MLEVQLSDLVRALSNYNESPQFNQALALAKERETALGGNTDFITLFYEAWNEVAPEQRLAQIFGTIDLRDRINAQSTNDEVIAVIREQAESAVANSFNVLRNRIDRFGNSSRILVELPGVKEPERVRNLLQGTASLEFWTTYENPEVFRYLQEVNTIVKDYVAQEEGLTTEAQPAETAAEAAPAAAGSASGILSPLTSSTTPGTILSSTPSTPRCTTVS